ncbi:hypothetical protein EYC84_002654 [Monilinia fructicola]|uniref:Uncharacterized protein n=1 Tax=Monilinia fructicola TaxID=38448 RepID=A0A5M9JLJ5_MONFR|nr:hypothetical protein EYC84_002654 [Monilinia fructicola]
MRFFSNLSILQDYSWVGICIKIILGHSGQFPFFWGGAIGAMELYRKGFVCENGILFFKFSGRKEFRQKGDIDIALPIRDGVPEHSSNCKITWKNQ